MISKDLLYAVALGQKSDLQKRPSFWEAMRFFDKKEGLLVTLAQEDEFAQDGFKINVLPFHKLLPEG